MEVEQEVQGLILRALPQLGTQTIDLVQERLDRAGRHVLDEAVHGGVGIGVLEVPVLVEIRAAQTAEQRVLAEADGLTHGMGGLIVGKLVRM